MDQSFYYYYIILVLLWIPGAKSFDRKDNRTETILYTRLGVLKGITERVQFDGQFRNVSSYLGIPYAKPPLCERRFSRPEPYGDLYHFIVYNAMYYKPHCTQFLLSYSYMKHFHQSEDCLYLNIFTPITYSNDRNYAVMIYIHGGSFVAGGADVYSGDVLSTFNDVIVVTINYRLNVFGFLSTGEKSAGNYGLWDMKLAIQWVHDYIEDFGGDPTRVTLFGNSAGGAAVLYQAINPGNRGLFQRVIAQSGSCFAFWAIQKNPKKNFNSFASSVGCDKGNYDEKLSCLRNKPIASLVLPTMKYRYSFVPSVDSDFVLGDPKTLSERTTEAGIQAMSFYSELDLLTGVLSQDGAYSQLHWSGRDNVTGVSRSYFVESYVPNTVLSIFDSPSPKLTEYLLHQYTDWSMPYDPLVIRNNVVNLESDTTFFIPAIHASKSHVKGSGEKKNNTYFYVFDHKPDFAPEPEWLTGATHAIELPYIFGFTKSLEVKMILDYYAVDPFVTSKEDIQFSKLLMKFWTHFAKTGNPNFVSREALVKTSNTVLPEWPVYSLNTELYLELRPSSRSVKDHFVASRVAFWEKVVPLVIKCNSNSSVCPGYISKWESKCLMISVFMLLKYLISM